MILKCKENFGDNIRKNTEYDVIKVQEKDFIFYKVCHNYGQYWTTKERIDELFYSIRDIRKMKIDKLNENW